MAEIKKEPIESYYEVGAELGRGRFAVVRKCISKKTGEIFAGKFVRKARQGRSAREQLLLEIDILHTSKHPKMVRLYDVFETRTEMVLVIEYAPGGDLHRHCLEQVETVRTEKEICHLIRQIVEAVRYLHDNNVVHLDLKPENILLKTECRFPEIRLIDFGLSRRLDVPYSQFDIVGTPEYVAPEVLSYEPLDVKADMWSIGVVTYVLLSGISPFAGDDVMETYANIGQVEYDFDAEEFDDISDEAKDFIDSLLLRQPKKRMTSRVAMEHPWLKQLEDGIKPEDIADAIKAESIIPTDVLTKAAELNPVEEETVSDSESEDCLSRDSGSSPEEETVPVDIGDLKDHSASKTDSFNVDELIKKDDYLDTHKDENQPAEEVTKHESMPDVSVPCSSAPVHHVAEILPQASVGVLQGAECKQALDSSPVVEDVTSAPDSSTLSKPIDLDSIVSKEELISDNNVSVNDSEGKAEPLPLATEIAPLIENKSLPNSRSLSTDETQTDLNTDISKSEPVSNNNPPSIFPLYDALLCGLEEKDKSTKTDENMNDNSLIPESKTERKKSTVIDIDAILGISSTPSVKEDDKDEDAEIVKPVKTTFNVDDFVAKALNDEDSKKENELPKDREKTDLSAKEKPPSRQSSSDLEPIAAGTAKIKATAALFTQGKKDGDEKEHILGKSSPKLDRSSWKTQRNQSARLSLDSSEPKPRKPFEKSRSAETYDNDKSLNCDKNTFGSVPSNVSQVKKIEPLSFKLNGSCKNETDKSKSKGDVSEGAKKTDKSESQINRSRENVSELSEGKRSAGLQTSHKLQQVQSPGTKMPSPCDDVKAVRHGIAAQMASKFSGKGDVGGKENSKVLSSSKEKDIGHASKISQRIQELSSGSHGKSNSTPPSSRSGSERSTPERTFSDHHTPDRNRSERNSPDRPLQDWRTSRHSSSEKSSSGRSTPERKVFERSINQRTGSGKSTPERGRSPVGNESDSKRSITKSREPTPVVSVSDRVKRAEVMFKKEDSPPCTSPKSGVAIGLGTPMKVVLGESFKVDVSAGGIQLGSKQLASAVTPGQTIVENKIARESRQKQDAKKEDQNKLHKTAGVTGSVETVNGTRARNEKKPRSKTDTETLKKAAELIRNTPEDNEGGRRRPPSMAELRGKNPSLKGDKGSPTSPRKAYRRLYVTHVKGSKALEVAEGPLSDLAEVKQKVDEDGLQVQLVMKLPTF